jgi:hypothetical protein
MIEGWRVELTESYSIQQVKSEQSGFNFSRHKDEFLFHFSRAQKVVSLDDTGE